MHGWSAERIARATGLGERQVLRIERGDRSIPFEVVMTLARAFGQPPIAEFPAKQMYPYFLRLLNVDIEMLLHHEHHGQEFIYVLEGELELTTYSGDRAPEILRAGDACYLDSTVPHLLRSWTRNPYSETSAEVLAVFWCPLVEDYLFRE
jgi:transcriptional regulator with XRE-family HTH domain